MIIKVYAVIRIHIVLNLIYAITNFNMHQSVDKLEYFIDSLTNRKSFKLVDGIPNQFIHQSNFINQLIISKNAMLMVKYQKNIQLHPKISFPTLLKMFALNLI